jgi:hypothetical protein
MFVLHFIACYAEPGCYMVFMYLNLVFGLVLWTIVCLFYVVCEK